MLRFRQKPPDVVGVTHSPGAKPRAGGGTPKFWVSFLVLYLMAMVLLFTKRSAWEMPSMRDQGGMHERHRRARLDRAGNMSLVDGPLEKYVSFLVCKGYCNQLMAFADGIAMCYLLNATCVLPKWYRHYDYFEPASQTPSVLANSDPQAHYAEDMDYYFDKQYLIGKMSGLVKIVHELPPWLQGEPTGSYDELWPVDPARPHTLLPFEQLLRHKNVLRLRCTLHLIVWNTEGLGVLRTAIHSALRPSKRLQGAYESRLAATAAAMGLPADVTDPLPYLSVHIRDEADWYKYCRQEAANSKISQISSFEACYKTAEEVAAQIVEWGLHRHYKHVYIANGNFSLDKARVVMEAGQFETLVSEAAMCRRHAFDIQCTHIEVVEGMLEFRAAVDLLMLEHSTFFVGNAYSSFSWTVRLARLFERESVFTPSDTLYYNMEPSYTAGDLQREETLRFAMQAGVIHPEWHAGQLPAYYWLHLQHLQGQCLHKHSWAEHCASGTATPPSVADLRITSTGSIDSGYLFVKGYVQANVVGFNWHPRLILMMNNQSRASFTAYMTDEDGSHVHLGQSGFDATLPILAEDTDRNRSSGWYGAAVCIQGSPTVCSKESTTGVQTPLRRQDEDSEGILWVWMPGKYRSGGPEALHQLHQEVNKWHAAGKIAIRSVFPEGDDFYRGQYSNFVPKFEYYHPGPKDYLVVPEHHSVTVPREFQYVMQEVGTQGLVWHVGQHVSRLAITVRGKQNFKPICLSPYFARLLQCPQKAIVNVPMSEVFLEMGRQEDAHPSKKENLILFDFDDTAWFNPTELKLPPGAKLVLMKGLEREEVLALLKRAKVYLDTYLTGNERAVFESTLFNCIPIVANHGPATSWHDFPLYKRYKWNYHDYRELSNIIHFAVEHYGEALREVLPFKQYIYRMPNLMSENVRTYFQDDVHVVLPVISSNGRPLSNMERFSAFAAMLFAIIQYPFSSQELVFENAYYAEFDAAAILYHLHSAGLLSSYTNSQVLAEYRRFGPKAVYFQRPLARHHREYTLIIPPGRMPLHPNLAATLFKAAYGTEYVAVFGPDNVVLADWSMYYDLVNANLWYFDDDFTMQDLQQLLTELNRPFLVLPRVRELPEDQRQAIPWLDRHSCDVVTLEMFGKPPSSTCFCTDLLQVTSHDLWTGSVNKIPADDGFRLWLQSVQSHCARRAWIWRRGH